MSSLVPSLLRSVTRRIRPSQPECVLVVGSPDLKDALQHQLDPHTTLYSLCPSDIGGDPASAVANIFERIERDRKTLTLVIFQPPAATPHATADLTTALTESRWQATGYHLFHIAQAAIKQMHDHHRGSLIVLGSSLAQNPQPNLALDTAMYAGMRALTQSLSREFHPQGLHISYVALPEPATADAAATATLCLQLHAQPQSVWTQEVEMG